MAWFAIQTLLNILAVITLRAVFLWVYHRLLSEDIKWITVYSDWFILNLVAQNVEKDIVEEFWVILIAAMEQKQKGSKSIRLMKGESLV